MPSSVDYDRHYVLGPDQCGAPFPEVVRFFEEQDQPHLTVLDLGCGQGRDALLAARLGHAIVGVDLSEIGLKQLAATAHDEGLEIECVHSDVASYRSSHDFDVVILDRVLHLIPELTERKDALAAAAEHAKIGGTLLVADTPTNVPWIRAFFDDPQRWDVFKRAKGFVFATKQ